MGLNKFKDNDLPFYKTIYSGMKIHDKYDWFKGIDKRNLLMKSLGYEGREEIKNMTKK